MGRQFPRELEVSRKQDTNIAITLLKEIIDYRHGKGKYNFSHLNEPDRSNECYDAWMTLEDKIINYLKGYEKTTRQNP